MQRIMQDRSNSVDLGQTNQLALDDDSDNESTGTDGEKASRLEDAFSVAPIFPTDSMLLPSNASVDMENPSNRVRLEWYGMLASVLNGDVVNSEKKRFLQVSGAKMEPSAKNELWLAIRAKANGRDIEEERLVVEQARNRAEAILKEVLDFTIHPPLVDDGSSTDKEVIPSAIDQIHNAISKVDRCERLYPSIIAMKAATPITATAAYDHVVSALNAWENIRQRIQFETSILQKWVGNAELDLTRKTRHDTVNTNNGEESSFIERVLKENEIEQTFNKSTLTNLNELFQDARQTFIDYHESFQEMKLPSLLGDLLVIVRFPSNLIEESMRMRLTYAKNLREPTMIVINQLKEDFQVCFRLAVVIKLDYATLSEPQEGWKLPPLSDDNFEAILLSGLKSYFKILGLKLESNDRTVYFKEAELLEEEWEFTTAMGRSIEGGDVVVAEQFRLE